MTMGKSAYTIPGSSRTTVAESSTTDPLSHRHPSVGETARSPRAQMEKKQMYGGSPRETTDAYKYTYFTEKRYCETCGRPFSVGNATQYNSVLTASVSGMQGVSGHSATGHSYAESSAVVPRKTNAFLHDQAVASLGVSMPYYTLPAPAKNHMSKKSVHTQTVAPGVDYTAAREGVGASSTITKMEAVTSPFIQPQLTHVHEHVIYHEVEAPRYVDIPIKKFVETPVAVPIKRRIPKLCTSLVQHEITCPKIVPKFQDIEIPIFIPRFCVLPNHMGDKATDVLKNVGLTTEDVTHQMITEATILQLYEKTIQHQAIRLNPASYPTSKAIDECFRQSSPPSSELPLADPPSFAPPSESSYCTSN